MLLSLFSGYLVRIYAWRTILGKQGLLNSTLHWLGLIDAPLDFLIYSNFAVVVTLTGLLLPLAVLPIYSAMANISREHLEAARDLGSRGLHLIRTILVPMALPGIAPPSPSPSCSPPAISSRPRWSAARQSLHDRQCHRRPVPRHRLELAARRGARLRHHGGGAGSSIFAVMRLLRWVTRW